MKRLNLSIWVSRRLKLMCLILHIKDLDSGRSLLVSQGENEYATQEILLMQLPIHRAMSLLKQAYDSKQTTLAFTDSSFTVPSAGL